MARSTCPNGVFSASNATLPTTRMLMNFPLARGSGLWALGSWEARAACLPRAKSQELLDVLPNQRRQFLPQLRGHHARIGDDCELKSAGARAFAGAVCRLG